MNLLSYTYKSSFKLNFMSARCNNISQTLQYFVSDVYRLKDDDIEHVCEIILIPSGWHEGFCKSAFIDQMICITDHVLWDLVHHSSSSKSREDVQKTSSNARKVTKKRISVQEKNWRQSRCDREIVHRINYVMVWCVMRLASCLYRTWCRTYIFYFLWELIGLTLKKKSVRPCVHMCVISLNVWTCWILLRINIAS